MTRKQKIVAVLSVLLTAVLLLCTAASMRIYRRLLPEVVTAPLERRAVYSILELQGVLESTGSGRRIACSAAAEDAARIPERCRGQVAVDGAEHTTVVVWTDPRGASAAVELTVPTALRDLPDGTELSARLLLDGGVYDYVLPASCVYGSDAAPFLLTVTEFEGLTGPELRVEEFQIGGLLFTNGEYTAIRPAFAGGLPEEAVVWSSQPLSRGASAKWREGD